MQLFQGYDNASNSRVKDDLERWRFAVDMADVIRSTPADWSARLGLLGPWGSGKSTILRYISEYLTARGYVVVNFNAASHETLSESIGSFGLSLIDEFARRDLFVEPKPKRLIRKARWLTSKLVPSLIDSAGEFHKGAKLANVTLSALLLWLRIDGEQIKRLKAQLPESRVVVLVDDLDRCSKSMLPDLLLYMREMLDLPKFSFILAFDDNIVAKMLSDANPAWGNGQEFLDKILDFRFSVPTVTRPGLRRLLANSLREHADFVPADSTAEIEDLLPTNPRRLKALVRSVRGLRSIIERHNPDEFSWTDIWLMGLLRQESHAYLSRLQDENLFEHILGFQYQFLQETRKRQFSQEESPDKAEEVLESRKNYGCRVHRPYQSSTQRHAIQIEFADAICVELFRASTSSNLERIFSDLRSMGFGTVYDNSRASAERTYETQR